MTHHSLLRDPAIEAEHQAHKPYDQQAVSVVRIPRGAECQCTAEGCGLFFSGESAFKKHWTKTGHVHPSEVGMVERAHKSGPVWGLPGENPHFGRNALASRQEGP